MEHINGINCNEHNDERQPGSDGHIIGGPLGRLFFEGNRPEADKIDNIGNEPIADMIIGGSISTANYNTITGAQNGNKKQ